MAHIIDRRENPKGRNHGNRQRFIKRAIDQIKGAVKESIKTKNIKDLTSGENIKVPVRNLNEPVFGNDPRVGKRNYILPSNKEYTEGDRIAKPEGGQSGNRGNEGSPDGSGEDEFSFSLTRDEFMDIFFEDLELPNLTKQKLKDTVSFKMKRSGYTNTGNPTNIDVKQTSKLALARRIALRRPDPDEIQKLENLLTECFIHHNSENCDECDLIETQLRETKRRLTAVPWIDPVDVRYKNFTPKPVPVAQAVMICIMDVSGSMGEREKDIAKRFFLLLHMFLHTKYNKVELVFIRHTHEAQEVDEDTFFYGRETGGTIVSEALKEARKIIKDRYPVADWNIYCAQASDGDNYGNDSKECIDILSSSILLNSQYMAYLEITNDMASSMFQYSGTEKELWQCYKSIEPKWNNFQMKKISNINEIYPIFRELFAKESH